MTEPIARHDPSDTPTPDTPTPSPEPDCNQLRILTWAAVIHADGQSSGRFRLADFAQIVRIRFDLERTPSKEWCRDVLSGLEWVTAYPGEDLYRVQTG